MLKFLASAAAVGYAAKKGYSKDLAKGLGIAGALFFASGLGVAGFNAFQNNKGIGDFFSAVGQTTMAGAQGLLGSIGLGSGVSSGLASSLGIDAGATLFGGSGGSGGTGSFIGDIFGGGGTSSASSTDVQSKVLNKNFGALQLAESMRQSQNKQLLFSAISTGAQAWLAHRQYKRKEEQQARLNFFGDRARGGSADLPFEVPSVMSRNNRSTPDTVGPPPLPSPFDPSKDDENDEEENTPQFMRGIA